MGTVTIHLQDEQDQQVFVELLAKAIRAALDQVAETRSDKPLAPLTTAQPAQEQPSLLVDVETVGSMLGVSRRMIHRMRDSGKMPRPVSMGRLLRWRRQDIEDWIRDGCRPVERRGLGRR